MGSTPHLFIPSKTATWVPEFAMEDLPLGRIAALVPEFAVKDLPLGRTQMMMMMKMIDVIMFTMFDIAYSCSILFSVGDFLLRIGLLVLYV